MMFFILVAIISLFTLGLHAITQPGMILEPLKKWLVKILPSALSKPMISCPICTTSIWGSIVYWSLHIVVMGIPSMSMVLLFWPLVCISSSFVNWFTISIFELIEEAVEFLQVRKRIFIRTYQQNISFDDIIKKE